MVCFMAYNSLNEDFLKMFLDQGAGKIGWAQLHSMHLMSSVTVSRSKHSIRSQKQKKPLSNIHSQCAVVLLKNHDSNLYLLTKI